LGISAVQSVAARAPQPDGAAWAEGEALTGQLVVAGSTPKIRQGLCSAQSGGAGSYTSWSFTIYLKSPATCGAATLWLMTLHCTNQSGRCTPRGAQQRDGGRLEPWSVGYGTTPGGLIGTTCRSRTGRAWPLARVPRTVLPRHGWPLRSIVVRAPLVPLARQTRSPQHGAGSTLTRGGSGPAETGFGTLVCWCSYFPFSEVETSC
jgi:hypothetical protein